MEVTFNIECLIATGDIVECAACGSLNAYSWRYANIDSNTRLRDNADTELLPTDNDVYHIGACDGYSFQCRACGAANVEPNAPILAECYTHVNYDDVD